MARPISVGHRPCDGLRNPDSEPAKMNCCGCQAASVSAAPPAIDNPTTALPTGLWPRLAASQAGNSWVRNVSHLYVVVPAVPLAGRYQSL